MGVSPGTLLFSLPLSVFGSQAELEPRCWEDGPGMPSITGHSAPDPRGGFVASASLFLQGRTTKQEKVPRSYPQDGEHAELLGRLPASYWDPRLPSIDWQACMEIPGEAPFSLPPGRDFRGTISVVIGTGAPLDTLFTPNQDRPGREESELLLLCPSPGQLLPGSNLNIFHHFCLHNTCEILDGRGVGAGSWIMRMGSTAVRV